MVTTVKLEGGGGEGGWKVQKTRRLRKGKKIVRTRFIKIKLSMSCLIGE